jgi:hypothetical protein
MLVNVYSVNADNSESEEALAVSLESIFPDDPDEIPAIEAELAKNGVAYYGGGASPLFKFVSAK